VNINNKYYQANMPDLNEYKISANKANALGQPKAVPLVPRSATFGCR